MPQKNLCGPLTLLSIPITPIIIIGVAGARGAWGRAWGAGFSDPALGRLGRGVLGPGLGPSLFSLLLSVSALLEREICCV